jgi:hypothetical protein
MARETERNAKWYHRTTLRTRVNAISRRSTAQETSAMAR